jgi:hypothetical protein
MAVFNVSAWFYVDIDVPGEEGTDEYEQALERVIENLEGSHAMLTTSYDTHLTDNIVVETIE